MISPRLVRSLLLILPMTVACPAENLGITDTSPGVASVEVAPPADTIEVGGIAKLVATARDSAGNPLEGRQVAWFSEDPSVATVDSTGLVIGLAPGAVSIFASSEDQRDSARVTVVASLGSSECESPQAGWIWCDDFEQDRRGSYFEYGSADGTFFRSEGVGRDDSFGMLSRFLEGQVSGGVLHLAFGKVPDAYFQTVDEGTVKYRDVYWRVFVRYDVNWVGGGGWKMSRTSSFVSSNWAQAMAAHVWSGSPPNEDYLFIDPASGTDEQGNVRTTEFNDFANLRWLGYAWSDTPIFDQDHIGPWYCVEARARLNDPGQSNGVFQLWIDGVLEAERTGLNWVGSYTEYGINAVFIENYWNGGAPRDQERYFDNVVISTNRIGC